MGEISGHTPSFPSCCKKGGRRHALDEPRRQRLYKLYDETNSDGSKKYAVKEICEMMGISKSTLYTYLGQR